MISSEMIVVIICHTDYNFLINQDYFRMGSDIPRKTKSGIEIIKCDNNGRPVHYEQDEQWQDVVQINRCCGFQFQKKSRKLVLWEDHFMSNCREIQDDFQWVRDLMEMVNNNSKLSKTRYLMEMSSLKLQVVTQSNIEQVLESEELNKFKQDLKKSVIFSVASARNHSSHNLTHQPIMRTQQIGKNETKSRLAINRNRSSFGVSHIDPIVMRKSIVSFVDDTITEMMGTDRQISKKTAKDLQIFLRFTMILENHLNDINCILGRVKRMFVIFVQKKYMVLEKANKDIGEYVDHIKQFLLLLRQSVIQFYKLHSFREGNSYSNPYISNDDNVLSACTSILFKDTLFYNITFRYLSEFNKQKQKEFSKILQRLRQSPPQMFFIKDKYCLNMRTIRSYLSSLKEEDQIFDIKDVQLKIDEPYSACIASLRELSNTKSPINKMKAIMGCSQGITTEIERFYNINGLRKENWVLDADQILSIFCYIIAHARVDHIYTHLFILDNFATSNQMISMTGYYLSVITCAVQQLNNDYNSQQKSKGEVSAFQ